MRIKPWSSSAASWLPPVSKQIATLAMIAVLASCGGGGGAGDGGGSSAICRSISGGGTVAALQSSPGCAGCMFTNSANSIDANENTFGSLTIPSVTAGDGVARVTAQNGVIFGGGSRAGVLADSSSAASLEVVASLILRTYLRGVLQEENVLVTNVIGGGTGSPGNPEVISFKTTKDYDAVEFGITGTAENFSANIHEFCSN